VLIVFAEFSFPAAAHFVTFVNGLPGPLRPTVGLFRSGIAHTQEVRPVTSGTKARLAGYTSLAATGLMAEPAAAGVITLTRVPADAGGTVDPAAVEAAITPTTRLIALTHASNVLGTIQPVGDVGRIAREHDLLFLVDAAQTAGVVPIDVQALCVDLLAFPGHKSLLGPTGTGALYVGPRVDPRPWREGGTGGDSLTPTQPADFPHVLEGGTPNVLGIAGLVAGLDFVEERGVDAIRKHEVELCDRLRVALAELPGFEVYGHGDPARRVGTVSFRCDAVPAPDLGAILDTSFDIAVRPGLHCAPYVHKALGTAPDGLVRVSPGPFTTDADIDRLIGALKEIAGA
ncbi:MAG: aminotransferase class V-fold PLP-dependent enzyme, partial [Gemmataceae bacterium]|nr:aminotransferase class V-fold PLP-dependent enzyme [Gemmataceae bacterium]